MSTLAIFNTVVVIVQLLSHVQVFVTPWAVARGSSVHGISQARILEWIAISFSRRSSWPRDWTHVSCVFALACRFFTTESWGEAHLTLYWQPMQYSCLGNSMDRGASGYSPWGHKDLDMTEQLNNDNNSVKYSKSGHLNLFLISKGKHLVFHQIINFP